MQNIDRNKIQSYKFFDDFLQKVFIERKSFITTNSENINLKEALEDIKTRYIDNPLDGGNFHDKLPKQFGDSSPNTKIVFTNMYYLYLFANQSVKDDTKLTELQKLNPSINKDLIPSETGCIGKFGMGYSFRKYENIATIYYILKYLLDNNPSFSNIQEIKKGIEEFCLNALYDTQKVKEYLYINPKGGKVAKCGIHNGLLHLSNPKYENILTYSNKEAIVKSFNSLIEDSKNKNLDEKIIEIKQKLQKQGLKLELDR